MHATPAHHHRYPVVLSFVLVLFLALLTSCAPGKIIPIAQVTPDPTAPVSADSGWTSYTSTKSVRDMEQDLAGNVWVATGGGVVRWNLTDGTYSHFTTTSGLSSNDTVDIEIDASDQIWLATKEDGVNLFDGTSWHIFNDQNGQPFGVINLIKSDSTGHLYVGTMTNGLIILTADGTSISLFGDDEGAPDRIDLIMMAPDSTLWVTGASGEKTGVFHYVSDSWNAHPTRYPIQSIVLTSENDIFIETAVGEFSLDGQDWIRLENPDFERVAGASHNLTVKTDDILWTSDNFGLRYMKENDRRWTYAPQSLKSAMSSKVTAILSLPDGTLLFGTLSDGFFRFSGTANRLGDAQFWTQFRIPNEPAAYLVRALDFDVSGIGWFATDNGISRFDGTDWKTLVICAECPEEGYWEEKYWSIAVAMDGAVWVGSRSQGVSRLSRGKWRTFTEKDGLTRDNYNYGLAISPDGTVWFGNGDGISIYKNGKWTTEPERTIFDDVEAITVGPDGKLWAGSFNGGLSVFDPADKTWQTFTPSDGLVADNIHAIAIDPDNVVWVGTSEGISRFDGDFWQTLTTADGLAENEIWAVAVDPEGGYWFGTRNAGVSFFDGNTWTHYTTLDGLASNRIHAIQVASDGAVWFATESGISRFCPPERSPCTIP